LEGPRGGCIEACERMHNLSAEQNRVDPSERSVTAISHTRTEMGNCLYGLYHRASKGTGARLNLCCSSLADEIHTIVCDFLKLLNNTGRVGILLRSIPVARATQEHYQ